MYFLRSVPQTPRQDIPAAIIFGRLNAAAVPQTDGELHPPAAGQEAVGAEFSISFYRLDGNRISGNPLLDSVEIGIFPRVINAGCKQVGEVQGAADPQGHTPLPAHVGQAQFIYHHLAVNRHGGVFIDHAGGIGLDALQRGIAPDEYFHAVEVILGDGIAIHQLPAIGLITALQIGDLLHVYTDVITVVPAGVDRLAYLVVKLSVLGHPSQPQEEPDDRRLLVQHAVFSLAVDEHIHGAIDQERAALLADGFSDARLVERFDSGPKIHHQRLLPQPDVIQAVVLSLYARRRLVIVIVFGVGHGHHQGYQ